MEILFYTTRNITSDFTAGLLANIKLLETESTTIDFLTSTKTNKSVDFIKNKTNLSIRKSINLFTDFYINECLDKSSWKEIYDSLDVSYMEKYDKLFIMGGLLHPSAQVYRYSNKLDNFIDSSICIKFRQVGINIINVLGILKAHKEYNIPLHEFSYDTDELCCSLILPVNEYYQYHIYDIPRYNMKRLDSLLYHLKFDNSIVEVDKIYDFTFGYTVYPNGNRPSYIEYVNNISEQFNTVNLYTKNKLSGVDTSISRENYLFKIKQSRFTLIIPSYDNTCFSLYRFIESIHNGCLPILHPSCFTKEVEESFNVKFDKLIDRIPSEQERLELLEYYKTVLTPTYFFKNKI